jgi:hypothetical protein
MNPTTDHPTSELLALHAGGDLTVADAQVVNAHLASCEFCREEVSELSISIETVRAMAVEPDESAARTLRDAVLLCTSPPVIRWRRISAAAAIIIVAGAGALWFGYRAASTREVVAHVAPTQTRNERSKTPGLAVKEQIGPRRGRSPRQIQPVRVASVWAPRQRWRGSTALRLEEVSRQTEAGEPTELRLVSSNPRVVVLWQISDTNASPEETGTEGINKQ